MTTRQTSTTIDQLVTATETLLSIKRRGEAQAISLFALTPTATTETPSLRRPLGQRALCCHCHQDITWQGLRVGWIDPSGLRGCAPTTANPSPTTTHAPTTASN